MHSVLNYHTSCDVIERELDLKSKELGSKLAFATSCMALNRSLAFLLVSVAQCLTHSSCLMNPY